jgi:hypothetical protein
VFVKVIFELPQALVQGLKELPSLRPPSELSFVGALRHCYRHAMHQMLESPIQRFGIALGIPSCACAQRGSAAAQAEKPPLEQLIY